MRKVSREMSAEWALEVFDKAPYITVSMTGADGREDILVSLRDGRKET